MYYFNNQVVTMILVSHSSCIPARRSAGTQSMHILCVARPGRSEGCTYQLSVRDQVCMIHINQSNAAQ